ncbi:MAG TPA: hypothetical protein GYA07_03485 [Verrucomicrobia bacterium]|nr:hypothetical protein [Verrucomicrobiota bacterium]HOP96654.1 hypothetical protein [Verrucomicrobiota bacterium]HPU56667.1 hypothetical protein [Verrucomicrobiota bacterium]
MRKLVAGTMAALLALTLVALSQNQRPGSTNAVNRGVAAAKSAPPATNSAYVVIGHLEKRDHLITVKSGPKGPVYTVATKDGKVLMESASKEQLRAQAPELYQMITDAVALDARVNSAILNSR